MADPALPVTGQDPWDADLNAVLADLQTRVAANDYRIGSLEARVTILESSAAKQTYTANYTLSNQTQPPPTNGQIRMNAATPSVTHLFIARVNGDGVDDTAFLTQAAAGSEFYIQTQNDASQWSRYAWVSHVQQAAYLDVTVAYVDSGSAIGPNKPVVLAMTY